MNKLSDLYISIEMANKLIESGIEVLSFFYWVNGQLYHYDPYDENIDLNDLYMLNMDTGGWEMFFTKPIPAPTFAELVEHIPDGFEFSIADEIVVIWKEHDDGHLSQAITKKRDNLANSLAESLIELKKEISEEGLTNAPTD